MSVVAPATGPLSRLLRLGARRQYGPPIEASTAVYARHPRLLLAFALFNGAAERPGALGRRLKDLASLRAATVVECEFCIDIGSEHARRSGLTDEQLLALSRAEASGLFSEPELVVIAYAEALARTPAVLGNELLARAKRAFTDKQLVELAYICAWENTRARLNIGLGIEPGGFSGGRTCARPESESAETAGVA